MIENENNDLEYKIITLGDNSVGKTSIINRFINGEFRPDSMPTLGIKHSFKILELGHLNNKKKLKLSVIDTGGQEKYKALSISYFRYADVVLFIFNLNEPFSFENIQNWIDNFNENNNKSKKVIKKYLIGNKSDLEQKVEQNLIDEFAKKNIMPYKATSAKTNSQINELFQMIGEELYEEIDEKSIVSVKSKSVSRILTKTQIKHNKNCC